MRSRRFSPRHPWGWWLPIWLLLLKVSLAAPPPASEAEDALLTRLLTGRQVRQQRIGVEQGLSHSLVQSILQDRQGFVWIGTEEGLNRYDGQRMRVFHRTLKPEIGLQGAQVAGLLEDPAGILWLMMREGVLSRFDPATERFTHFRAVTDDDAQQPRFHPNALARSNDGMLWLGSNTGLWRFDPGRQRFQVFRPDPDDRQQGPGDHRVPALLRDAAGVLWVGTRSGLERLDADGRFHPVLDNHEILALASAPGGLWVGTREGLLRLHGERVVDHYRAGEDSLSLRHDQVNRLLAAGQRGVWVGTSAGLHLLVETTEAGLPVPDRVLLPEPLRGLSARPLALDRDGGLWSAARGKGVIRLDPHGPVFRRHPLEDGPAQRQPVVLSLGTAPDGQVWIGTWGNGLYRLDPGQGTPLPVTPGGREPGNSISRFAADRAGRWWVASYDGGLSRWDPVHRRFLVPPETRPLPPADIQSLAAEHHGGLWIGTHNQGLYRLPPDGAGIRRYRHDPADPASPSSDDVLTLQVDRQGTLWAGTASGLNRLGDERFQRFRHDPADPTSLSDDFVKSLLEDQAGRFWVATNLGLNRLDRDTGRFRVYTTDDGLPHNRVNSLLEDDLGYLWLGTANGLSRFDPMEERFENFGPADGLPGRLFFYPAATRDQQGRLYFGGPDGLVSLDPRDFVLTRSLPPARPVLTGLRLFHRPVDIAPGSLLPKALAYTRKLTLSHRDRVFSLEFAAPAFSTPQRQRYSYRLQGFDDTWRETLADQRLVTFTALPPGHYRFQVRAANGDGPWGRPSQALAITVLAPWWATPWFRGLLLVLIGGLLAGGYRWRTRALARRNHRLETLVAERTRALEAASHAKSLFLAIVSHELRTPLNAILGFARLLPGQGALSPDQARGLAVIQQSGQHLLALIEDLLDITRIEAGRLDFSPEPVEPARLLEEILAARQLREAGRDVVVQSHAEALPAVHADARRLRQILGNLLDNALKYTDRGEIRLGLHAAALASTTVRVVFRVEDSGIGIPGDRLASALDDFEQVHDPRRGSPGVGLGLALCRRLVALMGGTLHLQSRVAGGDWASTAEDPPPPPAREHGTVVWFELELRRADGAISTTHPAPVPAQEPLADLRIPPERVLAALRETLADGDVQVLEARAGELLAAPEYERFWTRVLALANAFRLNELSRWLAHCAAREAPRDG